MFGGIDCEASGVSRCEMCDYGGLGRCCQDTGDSDYATTVISQARQPIKVVAIEKTYTESEVKAMIDKAVSKYELKCHQYKNEMLQMMQANKQQEGN